MLAGAKLEAPLFAISETLLPLEEKYFSFLKPLNSSVFHPREVLYLKMFHSFMDPPWKHFSVLFRVDNFCFIAHIKIMGQR